MQEDLTGLMRIDAQDGGFDEILCQKISFKVRKIL